MQNSIKKIIEIIISNFPNGIRDDFIDTHKVMRIYSSSYTGESISQDSIADVIHTKGIEHCGRFYFIEEKDKEIVLIIIDEILEQYSIVYYSVVHAKYKNFFARVHIFSPEVLKRILQETCTDYFYFDEFCSANKITRLDYEVSKIFMATGNSLSLEDLQKKLPYVPAEKILEVLNDMKRYLPTNTDKYFSVSKIKFDLDEIHAAKNQIYSNIDANGYVAPEDYDLSLNFALNPELKEKDLRNLIYEKFFSSDFTRRGKKLFKKAGNSSGTNATNLIKILRKFIADQEEISAEKLFAFAENFGIAQSVALYVTYESMTRVEKNSFVRDSLINFDVAGVDEALNPFVQGKIISLRSVNSFTGFPPIEGYSWNLFLLESFLRKYSEKYTYDAPAANSANVGAIYPKSMKFKDYLDVQVAVVVQENLPLEKFSVEEFLIGQGFRAKRIDKVTARIISLAQEILYH